MYDRALARKIDKSSCVVALGGGVIQDLTNYLSATYLRGVPFVQIPTTLLAQADIGMGGCAIDHPKVKSLVGSFYQPKFVFIDTKFLDTLPKSEISNGIAEIINKVVCLAGQNIGDLQKDIALMKSKDHLILKKYIILSNKIKKKIIEQDEIGFKGSRQVLDFGHTVTYALERILNYRISHGTALGIGMHGGALLSFQKGVLKRTELENLKQLISLADLPLHLPKKIDLRELLNLMHCDQKIKNGKIRFVLLKGFGKPFLSKGFDDIEIKKCLRKLVDN
jgi:3-dehydroquinate synthase